MNRLVQTSGLILGMSLLVILRQGSSDPLSYSCPNSGYSYSLDSKFQDNLNNTLTQLLDKASQLRFANFTNGTGIDQAYSLYYCTPDVDLQTCRACVQAATQNILQLCKSLKEGIVWYEDCTLRHANRSIFSLEEETPVYPYYNYTSNLSSYVLDPYRDIFDSTMKDLVNQAAYDDGFNTRQVNLTGTMQLRGLVQCTPDIVGAPCYRCLSTALRLMDLWANTIMFLPSCLVRFDIYGSPPPVLPLPHKNLPVGYIVLIVLLPLVLVFTLIGGYWFWKRRHASQDPLTEATQKETILPGIDIPEGSERGRPQGLARFTYIQVEEMTNGFTKKLGEGGYGVVYYGCLKDRSGKEVAVKVLSKNDAPTQFGTEIDVFGRISHKNLVSLYGYCEEGSHLALVYEYMSRGDLKALLSEQLHSLTWKKRLEIAIDAAQGLDYLHNGCSPPIVHRDVKPANILLNHHLRAKVADFGFSKIFPDEYVSNLSTRVVGTPGYVDPQYNLTGQLNEKGDVYSFGVVLLEVITGRVAISRYTNLVQWVTPLIESGDISSILDPQLRQVDDNYATLWKATELAMKCVSFDTADRPTMSQIVTELKECLAMETHAELSSESLFSTDALTSTSLMSPTPR